jgi:hypothetical protein
MDSHASPDFDRLSLPEQVSEICYFRFLELAKCGYQAVNRANPRELRANNPEVEARYQEAHRQVKQHLYHHKMLVREHLIPLVKTFIRHATPFEAQDPSATKDFRGGVLVQFDMLRQRLEDYAELLMPSKDIPSFTATLARVFEREKDLLFNGKPGVGLANYEVIPRYEEKDYYAPSKAK